MASNVQQTMIIAFTLILGLSQAYKIMHPSLGKSRSDGIECPKPTGQFNHPKYCDKFVNCWKGEAIVENCGPGTVFNEAIAACDYPRNVSCDGRVIADPPLSAVNETAPGSLNGTVSKPILGQDEEGGSRITLYEHRDERGIAYYTNLGWGQCQNIPDSFNDLASSVNTHGTCVYICEHENCQGRCQRFAPGTNCHGWLGDCGMNDLVSSVRGC